MKMKTSLVKNNDCDFLTFEDNRNISDANEKLMKVDGLFLMHDESELQLGKVIQFNQSTDTFLYLNVESVGKK